MKKNVRILTLVLTLALALTACGGNSAGGSDEGGGAAGGTGGTSSGGGGGDSAPITVRLGVVGSVYEQIWAPAIRALAAQGIEIEVVTFSDYVTPNNALANGEIDLNAFQHRIYLEGEVESHGYKIQNIGNTFVGPLNIYSEKIEDISELKEGDTVAIPDDPTNGGRALKVLAGAGLIELDPAAGFNPTLQDVTAYHVPITIKELKANTIPSVLPDVAAAVINPGFASDYGFVASDAVFADTSLDIPEYWNLIAARSEDLNDPERVEVFRKVVEAFQSEESRKVFEEDFKGFYVASGWDEDLLP